MAATLKSRRVIGVARVVSAGRPRAGLDQLPVREQVFIGSCQYLVMAVMLYGAGVPGWMDVLASTTNPGVAATDGPRRYPQDLRPVKAGRWVWSILVLRRDEPSR